MINLKASMKCIYSKSRVSYTHTKTKPAVTDGSSNPPVDYSHNKNMSKENN